MSPVVRRLPTTVRSELSSEGVGLDFGEEEGIEDMSAPDLGLEVEAEAPPSAPLSAAEGFAPGSLILDLENIASCRDEGHRVHRIAIAPHLVMEMGPGATSSAAHITDMFPARDPFALAHGQTCHMGIARDNAKAVVDLNHQAITAVAASKYDGAITACHDIGAARTGEIDTGVKPPTTVEGITAIAKSSTLPFMINSLNSLNIVSNFSWS